MKTKIIAHKGYSQKYPENTLISFRKAKELSADGIELDVHLTSDSELIVYHDYYLGKNNAGQGLIFNQPSKKIKSLDVGSWFNKSFSEERIPTLQQVFNDVGPNIHYEIELKGFTLDFLHQVINLVKINNLLGNVEFTSPHIELLVRLKSLYPETTTGLFVEPFPIWMTKDLAMTLLLNRLKLGMFNVAHCPLSIIDLPLITMLKNNEILVHAANCDTVDDLKKAYSLRVNQLSTINLETALKLRDETT